MPVSRLLTARLSQCFAAELHDGEQVDSKTSGGWSADLPALMAGRLPGDLAGIAVKF